MGLFDRLLRDARFALRGFHRTPGFFSTTVAILGLGIGMSVAMFTVFRTVLTIACFPAASFALGRSQRALMGATA